MGEEEKKPEEKKAEEAEKPAEEVKKEKKEEEKPPSDNKKEESKNEKDESAPAPPPPQEIILKVFMHCEGCARKVRRCLKGFEGVEDVITDCKSHKVMVKGEKADPLKVLDRVQRKSHRQVDLLSPIPKTPSEEEKSRGNEPPKPEEPKKEEPQIVTVVLRVHMHCEACAQEIKKRILRMKGVESAEADLKSSEVTVKGGFDPPKLVEYVYKRTGKHSVIAKQDPDNKKDKEEENKEAKEDKKGVKEVKEGGDGGDDAAKEINKEKKGGENGSGDGSASAEAITEEETKVAEFKNEYHYYPPSYGMEMYAYPYPYPPAPQIFSDENPNACSVM